jgi:WD40 repeat protein
VVFSPDGKLLAAATGPAGENITLWDTATGREVRQIPGTATLMRLAFSPDGKRLAASTNSNRCRVVEGNTGKELFPLSGSHGAFAAEGSVIVTGETAGLAARVRTWDAGNGTARLAGFPSLVRELAIAGDGRTLAVMDQADRDVVQVADLTKGTAIRSIRLDRDGLPWLALTADGKTLAVADGNGVRLWNMADGKRLRAWNYRATSRAVFSPDGQRLAWVGFDEKGGPARLWVVERDGARPQAVGEPVNNFEPPCFSPDGKRLAVVTDAQTISLREVGGGKEVGPLEGHDHPVIGLAFTPDGRHVGSRAGTTIFAWEARTGRLLRRAAALPGQETIEALLPDGRLLTADRTDNPLNGLFRLRDGMTGEEVWHFEGRPDVGPPTAVVAPGGGHVAVHGRKGEICVLDMRTGKCKYRLDPKEIHPGLKLSADGDVLVWHGRKTDADVIHVRRQASGKTLVLRSLPKTDRWLWIFDRVPCVSPDGRRLVLSTPEGHLRRWDLTTGEELPPLAESQRTVWELFWSPDSRFVAAHGSTSPPNEVSEDARQDVRVWDVTAEERRPRLTLPDRGGTSVLFSHDGRTLLTTDLEGSVHLWEVATGAKRGHRRGHLGGQIGALALSADGRMLASGGYDSQAFVWDLTGRMPDGRWQPRPLGPEQRHAAWEALAGDDGAAASAALWQLVADPEGTTALLGRSLRPVARPEPGRIARFISELGSEMFVERERAGRELEDLGESAAADLREALARKPLLEVQRRIEKLLEKLTVPPAGERLRVLRSLEVLEQIGTREAANVLRKMAEGAPGATVTKEARATLRRLERSPSDLP